MSVTVYCIEVYLLLFKKLLFQRHVSSEESQVYDDRVTFMYRSTFTNIHRSLKCFFSALICQEHAYAKETCILRKMHAILLQVICGSYAHAHLALNLQNNFQIRYL